jgi:cytochrome b561
VRTAGEYFTPLQRTLHWLLAAIVLAMLFIGIGMVSTLQPKFLTLTAINRPLGIAILLLAIFRLAVRLRRGTPSLPADLPRWQAISAKASHYLLYALLIAMPLVGWSMLSAGGYPIVLGTNPSAEDYAAQRRALCLPAQRPHDSRISVLRDHPSPCRGRALSHADTAGWRVFEHGGAMVGISRATGLHGKWKVGRHSRAAVRFCQRHEGCRERDLDPF